MLTDCAVRHRSVEESSKLELSSTERCRTAPFVNTFLPKSQSSNRETTSSSIQVVRENWQKLLCGWSQQTRPTVWADQISKVAWLLERSYQITKFDEFEVIRCRTGSHCSFGNSGPAYVERLELQTTPARLSCTRRCSLWRFRLEQLTNSELQYRWLASSP